MFSTGGFLWTAHADGSGLTDLRNLNNSIRFVAAWSPDATRIAYFSPRAIDGNDAGDAGGTTNLWLVKPDGSGSTPLTKLSAAISTGPEWHP